MRCSAGYKAVLHIHAVVEECEIVRLVASLDPKTKEKKKVSPGRSCCIRPLKLVAVVAAAACPGTPDATSAVVPGQHLLSMVSAPCARGGDCCRRQLSIQT